MKSLLILPLLFMIVICPKAFGHSHLQNPVASVEVVNPVWANLQTTAPLRLLTRFIHDPQEMLEGDNEYALFIYHQYNYAMVKFLKDVQRGESAKPALEARIMQNQPDSLSSQHSEDDADKNMAGSKKTVLLILSIVTFIGMVVLLVVIAKKFR